MPAAAASLLAPSSSTTRAVPTPASPIPALPTPALVFDTWQNTVHWDASGRRTGIDTRVRLRSAGATGARTPSLSLRLRYPASSGVGAAPTTLTGAGWRLASIVVTDGGACVDYLLTWTGGALAASRSTPELSLTLSAVAPGPATVSAIAWIPGAEPVAAPSQGGDVY